jgi:(+)-pinoresinol hydroxylase
LTTGNPHYKRDARSHSAHGENPINPPPGVNAKDFADALKHFEAVLGKENVFTSDEDLALYRDAYSPLWGEAADSTPSAALAPDTVEQVQEIARTANQLSIPLYTISTGRNLAYGGSAPVLNGSVVLDLKRMNRVLEVSEKNAFALVEPGVSYFDLYRHIRDKGLKLWIDCPEPGWGSLIGNAVDRGAGSTPLPYRDHFDAHCGMEVVLANGEIVRTGMGALPAAETWQQFKYGCGPFLDGMFSQSNFGIVTKMGFWLYPEPEACLVGRARVPHHDDIIPFVDILANLMYSGVINTHFAVRSPVFNGPPEAEKTALDSKPGGATPEEWNRYAASKNLNFWQTELHFYGPAKVVAAQWDHVKDRLSAISGATFEDGPVHHFPLSDAEIANFPDKGAVGIPSLAVFSSLRVLQADAPVTGHLDISPIIPVSGEVILKARKVFADVFREMGIVPQNGYAETFHWRSFIMFHGLPVTRDPKLNAKTRAAYQRMVEVAAEHGWGFYRTHIAFMDKVLDTYSYNQHSLHRLHETVKDAVDPKGILSAGRYGIWPKHLRQRQA